LDDADEGCCLCYYYYYYYIEGVQAQKFLRRRNTIII
jgi:hypothetical protein